MIIHINGMPGVGKFTVAQLLASSLSGHLIDNHRLIDAATTCSDHGSRNYIKVLKNITDVVFAELRTYKAGQSIILTNALADQCPEDIDRYNRCKQLAELRGEKFLAVLLTCSVEGNISRVQNPSRALKGKLTRVDRLLELRELYSIYHPENETHRLEIDSTNLSPEETSRIIQEEVERLD